MLDLLAINFQFPDFVVNVALGLGITVSVGLVLRENFGSDQINLKSSESGLHSAFRLLIVFFLTQRDRVLFFFFPSLGKNRRHVHLPVISHLLLGKKLRDYGIAAGFFAVGAQFSNSSGVNAGPEHQNSTAFSTLSR
jgi:hypothetical protein